MKKIILTVIFIIISFFIISKCNEIITPKIRGNVSKVMKNENHIDIFFLKKSQSIKTKESILLNRLKLN